MEVETESRQPLPDDLVLEIVVRCVAIATVIRCAATGKPIRRGILNAPFLRRLRHLLDSNDGHDARHFFLPPLLLGLYHQAEDLRRPPAFARAAGGAANYPASVAALPPAPDLGAADDSACDFGPYKPVASRRSLLVLRRRCKTRARQNGHLVERHGLHPVELSVCNPMTGERRVLPPNDVCDMSHVLLDVDPLAPSSTTSFKLLVADLPSNSPRTLFVQVFSSEDGQWGPAMACPIRRSCEFVGAGSPRPLVLGGTVHWLCSTGVGNRIITWRWCGDGGEPAPHTTSLARLPRRCENLTEEMCLAVQPSAAGDGAPGSRALLSVIVVANGRIEVWVREKGGGGDTFSWTLWHRIEERDVARPMDVGDRWLRGAELSWFCEGSGTVFLRPGDGAMSPLLLDLDSMVVSKIQAPDWELHPEPEFCPYEVDLISYMLFTMRHF
ncbi:hypothetical protein ACP4OV_027561 [Aristida adscensionis]